MPEPSPVTAARTHFPRGLAQPAGGFRFAADSLLLAAFARPLKRGRVLDLGCGCGVVGLAYLLRQAPADLRLTGLDSDPAMLAAAVENAARLGLAATLVEADLAAPGAGALPNQGFDLALANPPYHALGRGRVTPKTAAVTARFQAGAGFAEFAAAAARAVKTRARAAFVAPAENLTGLLAALAAAGLAPKRLRLVHGRMSAPARLCLVEAVRGGRPGLAVEPPLVLYAGLNQELTAEALDFCPFLACNSRRGPGRDPAV